MHSMRLFRRLVLSRWQQCWPPRAELSHSRVRGVGRIGRAHVNAHTNSSNTGPRVVRRWPSWHGRYCRAKMGRGRTCAVSCLSTVTPPCPFLPSLPAAALRCLGRAIDFPFPFLPQRNATVFGAARSSCVAALMRPERLGYRGFDRRSFGWPRVADGTMVSMRTVDKWRRSGRFFFLLN